MLPLAKMSWGFDRGTLPNLRMVWAGLPVTITGEGPWHTTTVPKKVPKQAIGHHWIDPLPNLWNSCKFSCYSVFLNPKLWTRLCIKGNSTQYQRQNCLLLMVTKQFTLDAWCLHVKLRNCLSAERFCHVVLCISVESRIGLTENPALRCAVDPCKVRFCYALELNWTWYRILSI